MIPNQLICDPCSSLLDRRLFIETHVPTQYIKQTPRLKHIIFIYIVALTDRLLNESMLLHSKKSHKQYKYTTKS